MRTRALVVDDSALVRRILSVGLTAEGDINVVGTAGDPYQARDRILELRPEVVTLDVEMPRMDGLHFLRRLMPQFPLPVIMVSSLTERGKAITLDCLEAGAVDFVAKPSADVARGLEAMLGELRAKVRAAARVDVSRFRDSSYLERLRRGSRQTATALPETTDLVVAVGASTGGTEAFRTIAEALPPDCPGVLVVQHMPPGFTRLFAERLDQVSRMVVREAEDGDRIQRGRILVAPGGRQATVVRSGGAYVVKLGGSEKVNGHCPSVGVMMESVAKAAAGNAIGVMLTGMGGDGADGLKAMRDAGAKTIAQDQASSVVFGMPKVAIERGAVEQVVPLESIAEALVQAVVRKGR